MPEFDSRRLRRDPGEIGFRPISLFLGADDLSQQRDSVSCMLLNDIPIVDFEAFANVPSDRFSTCIWNEESYCRKCNCACIQLSMKQLVGKLFPVYCVGIDHLKGCGRCKSVDLGIQFTRDLHESFFELIVHSGIFSGPQYRRC